jgi:hypothetical protein
MTKKPTPDLTNVGDVWFWILSPLNRAATHARDDDVRAEIAAAYFAVTEAFGFGGEAKIRRTPRGAAKRLAKWRYGRTA